MLMKFLNDESGATAIEYCLLAALIGLAIVTAAGDLGTELDTTLGEIEDTLAAVDPAS